MFVNMLIVNTHFGVCPFLECSMQRLAKRNLIAVLAFLTGNYAKRHLTSLRSHVISALPKLVPADVTAYNEVHSYQHSAFGQFRAPQPLVVNKARA